MTNCRVFLVLALAFMPWAAPADAAPGGDPCAAPDETSATLSALPRVGDVLKADGTLRVLAIGSATMFGPEATLAPGTLTSQSFAAKAPPRATDTVPFTQEASEQAFPRQMAKALQEMVPGVKVQVVVRGGRGMTAADMLTLMRTEIAIDKPQLILWQTGTVEAVRNTPPGEFGQVLLDGAEAAEQAGANLVLIDPQYSRFLQANSNLDPYAQALQQAATLPGTLLFHRFDLMRSWANAGQIDLERTPKADRRKAVETLHACLGASLARVVVAGARL